MDKVNNKQWSIKAYMDFIKKLFINKLIEEDFYDQQQETILAIIDQIKNIEMPHMHNLTWSLA